MKRKLITGLCISMLTLSLVGCSSNDKTDDTNNTNETTTEQSTNFTGEKTVETKQDKDTIITTIQFEGGKPVDVNIDIKQEDGILKSEISAKGEYTMKEGEEYAWHEQVDLLEKAVIENDFDLSKITLTNEEGNTDAVSGVSIKVGEFLQGIEECLKEAQK